MLACEDDVMQDHESALDDILSRWHAWQRSQSVVGRGYAPKSLVCGDFKVSRQYDDSNGQLDADLESRTMRTVDHQVDEIPQPWRTALYVNARALNLGLSVYRSPRLPSDTAELFAIIAEARKVLLTRLQHAGVL